MFVSIFDRRTRRVIGCMGALYPARPDLLGEVRHWTRMALLHDGRYSSVSSAWKNGGAAVIVTLVERVEPVEDALHLDSIRHGILVRSGGREALVLPGEAWTVAAALRIVAGKLAPGSLSAPDAEYFRVYAVRFGAARDLFFRRRGVNFPGYGG